MSYIKSLSTAALAACFALSVALPAFAQQPRPVQPAPPPGPIAPVTPPAALCPQIDALLNATACADSGNTYITNYNTNVNPNRITFNCTEKNSNPRRTISVTITAPAGARPENVQACMAICQDGACIGQSGRCMVEDPNKKGSCLVTLIAPYTRPAPGPAPMPMPAPVVPKK